MKTKPSKVTQKLNHVLSGVTVMFLFPCSPIATDTAVRREAKILPTPLLPVLVSDVSVIKYQMESS